MAPELGAIFAAAMHDYPAFRYIHQNLSGSAYEGAMQLTFEYYIALVWLDCEQVLGCWDNDELVGGMLVRLPGSVDNFDPEHPVTTDFISQIGDEAWERLDAFERMMDDNSPTPEGGCFYLDLLGAKPVQQRKGYGRCMLDYIADLARAHPTTQLVCLSTESPAKHALYEHFGYEKVSTATIGPVTSTSFILDTTRE